MILPIVVFVLLGVTVLSSVLVYKMSVHAVNASQQAHERANNYNKDLLDRLMATDFHAYKAYQLETRDVVTGFVEPDQVEEVPIGDPRRSGFGSSLGLMAVPGGDSDE